MDRTQQLIHCFYAMAVYCLVACKDSFYADHVLTPEYWPTDGWQQATPESQGVDSLALVELIEHARAEKVRVHNLLIIRHGYLILDVSFYPYEGLMPHDVASVTKSVTSTLLGAALHVGKLDRLDRSIFDVLGVKPDESGKKNITIEHLMMMRSGLRCGYEPSEPELVAMQASSNWPAFALSLQTVAPPGERFGYCSPGMHLLSAAISRLTQQNALSFARSVLFEPLGIHPGNWPVDPNGNNHGWGDLHLHPHDMAKLGFLFLHGGQWNGTRILPKNWVSEATRSHGPTGIGDDGYGYGWWVLGGDFEGIFEARGRGGQSITVWPRKDLVIVATGSGFDLAQFVPFLIDATESDSILPDNDKGIRRLQAALRLAQAGPEPHKIPPPPSIAYSVSGRTYNLESNALGFESIEFDFTDAQESAMVLQVSPLLAGRFAGRYQLNIGLNGRFRENLRGLRGNRVGLFGEWKSEDSFHIRYSEFEGPDAFEIRARFEGRRLVLSVDDPSGYFGNHKMIGRAGNSPIRDM